MAELTLNKLKNISIPFGDSKLGYDLYARVKLTSQTESTSTLKISFAVVSTATSFSDDSCLDVGLSTIGYYQPTWYVSGQPHTPSQGTLIPGQGLSIAEVKYWHDAAPRMNVKILAAVDTTAKYGEEIKNTKYWLEKDIDNFGGSLKSESELTWEDGFDPARQLKYTPKTKMALNIYKRSGSSRGASIGTSDTIVVNHGKNGKKRVTISVTQATISAIKPPYEYGSFLYTYIEPGGLQGVCAQGSKKIFKLYAEEEVKLSYTLKNKTQKSVDLPAVSNAIKQSTPNPFELDLKNGSAEVANTVKSTTVDGVTVKIYDSNSPIKVKLHCNNYINKHGGQLAYYFMILANNKFYLCQIGKQYKYYVVFSGDAFVRIHPNIELLSSLSNKNKLTCKLIILHFTYKSEANSVAIQKLLQTNNSENIDALLKYVKDNTKTFVDDSSDSFSLIPPSDCIPSFAKNNSSGAPAVDYCIYPITNFVTNWQIKRHNTDVSNIDFVPIAGINTTQKTSSLTSNDFRKYSFIDGKTTIGVSTYIRAVNSKYEQYDNTVLSQLIIHNNGDHSSPLSDNKYRYNNPEGPIYSSSDELYIQAYNSRGDSKILYPVDKDNNISNKFVLNNTGTKTLFASYNYSEPSMTLEGAIKAGSSSNMRKLSLTVTCTHTVIRDPVLVKGTNNDDVGKVNYAILYKINYINGTSENYALADPTDKEFAYTSGMNKTTVETVYNKLDTASDTFELKGENGSTIEFNYSEVKSIDYVLIWHDCFDKWKSQGTIPVNNQTYVTAVVNNEPVIQKASVDPEMVFMDVDLSTARMGFGKNSNSFIMMGPTASMYNTNPNFYPIRFFKDTIFLSDNLQIGYNPSLASGAQATNISLYGSFTFQNLTNASSGSVLMVDSSGTVKKQSSSRRYKTDIIYDIDSEKYHKQFDKLRPAEYKFIDAEDDITHLGFIAEDIASINPNIAVYDSENRPDNYSDRDMIALLCIELKRQSEKIKELEEKLLEKEKE
jgi:hypothetical protein